MLQTYLLQVVRQQCSNFCSAHVPLLRSIKEAVQAHYVLRHCCAVTVLCCAVPPLRCAAKGTSIRAEGAKVTRDDNWAADGLDLGKLPSQPRGNDYRSVKGEPATVQGEISPR